MLVNGVCPASVLVGYQQKVMAMQLINGIATVTFGW